MQWTSDQHREALQKFKEVSRGWNADRLREWARMYTRHQYQTIEKQCTSAEGVFNAQAAQTAMQQFDDSFYKPVFIPEYLRVGGLSE